MTQKTSKVVVALAVALVFSAGVNGWQFVENTKAAVALAVAEERIATAEARLASAMVPERTMTELLENRVTRPIGAAYDSLVAWLVD